MEDNFQNIVVIKRDGKKVQFDSTKIAIAIQKGFKNVEFEYRAEDINKVFRLVIERIKSEKRCRIKIEEIQDMIEQAMTKIGYSEIAREYREYREKRNQSREMFLEEKRKHKFVKALEKITLYSKESQEEDEKNPTEKMIEFGKIVSKEFTTSYLMKKKYSELHDNGEIYIKNIEHYTTGMSENCHIDLEKLFSEGFKTERCDIREPQSISSYAILAIIAITSNQKDQIGEQSIPAFDYYMAKGVLRTFKKEFRFLLNDILEYTNFDKFIALNGIEREIEKIDSIDFDISKFYKYTRDSEQLKTMFNIVKEKVYNKTEKQVYQAMEGFVHDLNSLCSNSIVTLNLGTDTSSEGRMITKNILKALKEGLGDNKPAISPKIIFKVKKNINSDEKTINYDLLKRSIELAKTTDNILFSFLDTKYNKLYKKDDFSTEVAYFQDGKRVYNNIIDSDKAVSVSRGFIASTVINLPRIALKNSEDLKSFYEELDNKLDIIKEQLLESFEIQANKKMQNFPFLIGEDVFMDAEKIEDKNAKIKKSIKHGALGIGFNGLIETIDILEKNLSKKENLGINIIKYMREKIQEFRDKTNLNFELYIEFDKNIAKRFIEIDRVIFGKINNITNKSEYSREYYNEFNFVNTAKYQELCSGGHKIELELKKYEKNFQELIKLNLGLVKLK